MIFQQTPRVCVEEVSTLQKWQGTFLDWQSKMHLRLGLSFLLLPDYETGDELRYLICQLDI